MSKLKNNILPILFFLLLLVFVVYPSLTVFVRSFEYKGQSGLGTYQILFTKPYFLGLIRDSVLIALGSAFCSTLLGLMLALVVFKTTLPFRKLVLLTVVLPMIIPGFVTSLSYIFLFGRNGLLTYQLFNISWEIYSWRSVLILQTLGFSTTTFFLISAVLVGVNTQVENAARNLGATEWEILSTIIFPLIRPGLAAAFLLSFLRSMADFGTPFIVGGRFNTLATMAYTKLIGTYDTATASALSVVLMMFCMVAFWIYFRLERKTGAFKVERQVIKLDPLRLPFWVNSVLFSVGALFSLIMLGLLVSVFLAAFTRHLGSSVDLTLDHFRVIPQQGWNSIRNTILFASITCLLTTFSGIVIAYLINRIQFIGKRVLDMIVTLPFAIPGTFIGIGYALAFNQPPLLLSGTWTIVVLCTVFRELPMGFRSGDSVLKNQEQSVEQASENLGASRVDTFFRIVLPLARPALIVSAIYSFITSTKTLGAIIFLITPGNKVLSVDIFEATVKGSVGDAAAFSIVLMAISIIGVGLIALVGKQSGIKTRFNLFADIR